MRWYFLAPQVLSARKIPVADSYRNVFDVFCFVAFVCSYIRWLACCFVRFFVSSLVLFFCYFVNVCIGSLVLCKVVVSVRFELC